ncbi:hypothetical protein [Arthrobacter pullicola]|nr:hypothetical protein [Arthrobacter pullicola]
MSAVDVTELRAEGPGVAALLPWVRNRFWLGLVALLLNAAR